MDPMSLNEFKQVVLNDYRLIQESRQASLLGRKEVLTGKAKFGIFGDGKELAQIALSKVFKPGDFRSGYYRDQTLMFAIGALTLEQWFAGLYGHGDLHFDPMSGGRQMGGHFATHLTDANGQWLNHTQLKNSSADVSPTSSQMPRLLGLAYASHFYKVNPELQKAPFTQFSNAGGEIAFGTIGDASTSEGIFWETLNAAGVLQVPMLISVWDDGHGISVPKKFQTTKESISDVLKGFQRNAGQKGFEIFTVKGWDYTALCKVYEAAAQLCRTQHIPVLVHVEELTQPQGHSTSGSHERYKSKERLAWESDFDGLRQMRLWIIANQLATEDVLDAIEEAAKLKVREAKQTAWQAYQKPILQAREELMELAQTISGSEPYIQSLRAIKEPIYKELIQIAKTVMRRCAVTAAHPLHHWVTELVRKQEQHYGDYLYTGHALQVDAVPVIYDSEIKCDGRELLRDNFKALLEQYPHLLIFGEDAGKIGGVNQSLEGLQSQFGEHRVFDTGIREATIVGQAIGLAMRGLRPIAEIQYLDYLLYALQLMSDDLATLSWRTMGRQKAPVIISTRGHRLEGVWHSGSPMGMIINACRGIYICVPRNMQKAAGFYNTLLKSDEPALVIEPLNGYRLKEQRPSNAGQFTTALGESEILHSGTDITLITYGSSVRIAQEAIQLLDQSGIQVELIDLQTLIPLDLNGCVPQSLKKTSRLCILDEDVPGGASAYIFQQLQTQYNIYSLLDAAPVFISAKAHRPAYGSDGDYFSKPNADDVYEVLYAIMQESNPQRFQ